MFNAEEKRYLLYLARRALEHFFATDEVMDSRSPMPLGDKLHGNDIDEELKQKCGTFVTLTKHGALRGCIGHIEPVQPLYLDVIENALASAFEDPRFMPLEEPELKEIDIEISVLTVPKKLAYSSANDLLKKLEPLRDGVIIRKGLRGATYLPQVWEDLTNKEEFLSSLCQKAGLNPDEWRKGELRVETYEAEVFGENNQ